MKGSNLGEFEELVLLTIGVLGEDAYGLSIQLDIKERTRRNPSMGALHSALTRLEKKGFVKSEMEGATSERRGRRKRFYRLTTFGIKTLHDINDMRSEMISAIPFLSFS